MPNLSPMYVEDKECANVSEQAAEFKAIPEFKKVSTLVAIGEGQERKLLLVMYDDEEKPVGKLEFAGFESALGFAKHIAETVFRVWPLEACEMSGKKVEDRRH